MIAHIYDEISCEWKEVELSEMSNRFFHWINSAEVKEILNNIDAQLNPGPPRGWTYVSHSITGPILTIFSRSDRGHHGITVVDLEFSRY